MNFVEPSDEELEQLRLLPKRVTNARAQWREKQGHRQRNFMAGGGDSLFEIYMRQNTFDPRDFSCGLSVIKPDGTKLTLYRYNGSSHRHGAIRFRCHIHTSTSEAIRMGWRPESHAEETSRYRTLDGALYCLVNDCDVTGIDKLVPDEPDMFEN